MYVLWLGGGTFASELARVFDMGFFLLGWDRCCMERGLSLFFLRLSFPY